jgi:Zn-dependent M28 family amino/carboxypeptidase
MGKTVYFPGANDNASGVAMLLSLARYYSQPGNKPNCSIVFMAFSGEEVGLLGSHYYVEHPLFPMTRIKFLTNMDILGTGNEGITVVNATVYDSAFKKLQEINTAGNYLPALKPRGKAAISDHHFFTEKNIPSFYIYTLGGIKAYHDTCDRRETLPLTEFEDLFSLLREFTDWVDEKK